MIILSDWRTTLSRWPHALALLLAAILLTLVIMLLWPAPDARTKYEVKQDIAKAPEAAESAAPPIAAAVQDISPSPAAVIADIEPEDKIQLPAAPDPIVTEKTKTGALPVIAEDGRKPWQVYARPYAADKRPQVAIVMGPVGNDRVVTNAAIEHLPALVTLAIDAQASDLNEWFTRARQNGHETLLAIPAEPLDYPQSDPGPGLLLSGVTDAENVRRLLAHLAKGSGYIGVTTFSGSRFVGMPKLMQPVVAEISKRGLGLFDAKLSERSVLANLASQQKAPLAAIDFRIDADLASESIDQILAQAARQAQQTGNAVCLIAPTPLAIDRLNHWVAGLRASGIRLAPLSAMLH